MSSRAAGPSRDRPALPSRRGTRPNPRRSLLFALTLALILGGLATTGCGEDQTLEERLTAQPQPSAGFPPGFAVKSIRKFKTLSGDGDGVAVELNSPSIRAGLVYSLHANPQSARLVFQGAPNGRPIVVGSGSGTEATPVTLLGHGADELCFLVKVAGPSEPDYFAECDILAGRVIVAGTVNSTGPAGDGEAALALEIARAGVARVRELDGK